MIRELILPALTVCLLTACSSDEPLDELIDEPMGEPANDSPSALAWSSCPNNGMLQCATLSVPIDYSNDQAGEIEIALNRLPASQQPASGALLFNPGGPGGAGTNMVEILASRNSIPEPALQQYDVIGFDPRGIGRSSPVDCDFSEIEVLAAYLTDSDSISAFAQQSADFAERCRA